MQNLVAVKYPPPRPSLPYKVDTSRPSLRTNRTRLVTPPQVSEYETRELRELASTMETSIHDWDQLRRALPRRASPSGEATLLECIKEVYQRSPARSLRLPRRVWC